MDITTPSSLSAKQMQAILHLAEAQSAHATAKIIGVTEQTISGWKNEPPFAAALVDERGRVEERTRKDLEDIAQIALRVQLKALKVVEAALNSEEPGIAFQAARVALRKS